MTFPLPLRQRRGVTYRVLDGGRFTVAVGGNYVCDGGHRRPDVTLIMRHPGKRRSPSRVTIPLPHVRFLPCYRRRRFGGMLVYRAYQRVMWTLCVPRSRRAGR